MKKITLLFALCAMFVLGASKANAEVGDVLDRTAWTVTASSACDDSGSGQPGAIIDGNNATFWHSNWGGGNASGVGDGLPEWFIVDLGSVQELGGFSYRPRNASQNGVCLQYKVFVSETPFSELGVVTPTDSAANKATVAALEGHAAAGSFTWTTGDDQTVAFDSVVSGQYVMFVTLSAGGDQPERWANCAEFNLFSYVSAAQDVTVKYVAEVNGETRTLSEEVVRKGVGTTITASAIPAYTKIVGESSYECVEGTTEYVFTVEQDEEAIPFEISASFAEAKWFQVRMHYNQGNAHFWQYNGGTSVGTAAQNKGEDNQLWCLVGNVFDGFKAYNKLAGETMTLSKPENGNVASVMTTEDTRNLFKIYQSRVADTEDKVCFKLDGDDFFLNHQGTEIKGWNDSDQGSCCDYFAIKSTEVASVTPVSGELEAFPAEIVLTFDATIDSVSYIIFKTDLMMRGQNYNIVDSAKVEGNVVTISLPVDSIGDASMISLSMEVVDSLGKTVTYGDFNEGLIWLEYSVAKEVDAALLEVVSATAETNEEGAVASLLYVFNDTTNPRGTSVAGFDEAKVVEVKNEAGEVVATGTFAWGDAWDDARLTLSAAISEAGTYTVVLPEATAYAGFFDPSMPDFGVSYGAIYNPEYTYSFTVEASGETPADFTIIGSNPADGSTVSELSVIELTFNEAVAAYPMMNPVVKNAAGDEVASLTFNDITFGADGLTAILTIPAAITTSGEYSLVIAANTFVPASWDMARPNAETTFKYTVEGSSEVAPLEVIGVYPAEGEVSELPTSVEVSFSEEIVGATAFVRTDLMAKGETYELEDKVEIDKSQGTMVKFNIPGNLLTGANQYTITIEARDAHGCVATYGDFEGYVSLTYSLAAPVDAATLLISNVAVNDTTNSLSSITVSVLDSAAVSPMGDGSVATLPEHEGVEPIVLKDSTGTVVATPVLGYGVEWNSVDLLFEEITEPGVYTLVIPEGALWNGMYDGYSADYGVSFGATYNAYTEVLITITEGGVVSGINGVAVAAGVNEVYYDLSGRVVANPVKGGIYIVNGKKVIKK